MNYQMIKVNYSKIKTILAKGVKIRFRVLIKATIFKWLPLVLVEGLL